MAESAEPTIAHKLRSNVLLTVGLYVITTTSFVALASLSLDTLGAARAYVQGESLWSKAQREAVRQLEGYIESGDESAFREYVKQIQVPLGDRRAREQLERDEPDFSIAEAGFRAGRNADADIPSLIQSFRRFRDIALMRDVIAVWKQQDREIDEIVATGDELHVLLGSASEATIAPARKQRVAAARARLQEANARVAPLEDRFFSLLGDTSRTLCQFIKWCTLLLAFLLLSIAAAISLHLWRRNVRIESALRASEEHFDLAVRGSNDGIWSWSSHSGELYFSPRALEVLGLRPDQMPRHPDDMRALVHPDERDRVLCEVDGVLTGKTPLDIEFRFRHADGDYRWARVRGRAVRASDANVHVAGSISDVTEHKRIAQRRQRLAADEQRRAEQAQIALLEKVQGQMGRELHDDLGQQLTGIAFLAKALEQRLGVASPERDQATWIMRLINEATDRVRFMSRQLSPIEIDEVTLSMALQRLVDDNQRIFGACITLRKAGDETAIPGAHANQFFRIAQEAINNALKHGHAKHILVRLDVSNGSARLGVCDDGCGFVVRKIDLQASLGLRSMALRAAALHGRLRVRSGTHGTVLVARSGDFAVVRQPVCTRKIA